jgi:uncharacterized protein (DUF983 family)
MNDHGTGKPPRSRAYILALVIGIVVFGLLIALRAQFDQMWLRVVVVACAGAVLGWVLIQARRRKG